MFLQFSLRRIFILHHLLHFSSTHGSVAQRLERPFYTGGQIKPLYAQEVQEVIHQGQSPK